MKMNIQLSKVNLAAPLMIAATISLVLSTAAYAQWGSLGDDRFSSGGTGAQHGENSQTTNQTAYTQEPNSIPVHQAQTVYTPSVAGMPNSSFMPYVSSGVPNGGFASYAPLAPALTGVPVGAGGLPPTTLDSFVKEAGPYSESIYGDEGTGLFGPPPDNSFTAQHRIIRGIQSGKTENLGLTTGHGSHLPDAWGGDEWTGNEWSNSGPREAHPKAQKEAARHVATPAEN